MTARKQNWFRRFFSGLGPGLITGSADDDPSGIATYSMAGSWLGTTMLCLLVAIVVVASDARLMKKQPSSKLALFSVSLTALLMFGAAIGMFFF